MNWIIVRARNPFYATVDEYRTQEILFGNDGIVFAAHGRKCIPFSEVLQIVPAEE